MHGRKKSDWVNRSDEEISAQTKKMTSYQRLSGILFDKRDAKVEDEETLLMNGQLLKVNPDLYTMWNTRKEIILKLNGGIDKTEYEEKDTKFWKDELMTATECIKKNPKSYGAWHHRNWCIDRMIAQQQYKTIDIPNVLANELALCTKFLIMDERNFHCWNYRRYIVTCMINMKLRTSKDEFDYSTEKIMENFSNYSAFHHRSNYIKDISDINRLDLVMEELEMIHQAMYTEPDDQSAWWYHQFLINWLHECVVEDDDNDNDNDNENILSYEIFTNIVNQEVEIIQDLLDAETDSKWATITLASMLKILKTETESIKVYKKLVSIDPDHKHRYHDIIKSLEG